MKDFNKKLEILFENYTKEMEDWYNYRTNNHINLVKKYCQKIFEYDSKRFPEIVKQGEIHDQSKFKNPERDPYIWISWKYKTGAKDIPQETLDQMHKASEHHVKSNKHHPEAWSNQTEVINQVNRDLPPSEMIDATKMPDNYVAEMVADWCAMSEELKNSPKAWADKNINVRWKFTNHQKNLIYELIGAIWK